MTMKIEGMDDLNAVLAKLPAEFDREATALVNRTAQNIRNTAVRSIQKHLSSGVTYEKYKPRRTHIASAPGQPPNTDTGRLVGSIRAVESGTPTAYVEALAGYARHLEFGTRNMAARPFMTPAVEAEREKFRKGVNELTAKATRWTK